MSGDHIDIKGRGTAAISKNCSDIGIDNVLYTPDSAINLLSVSRLTESDLDVLFRKGKAYVYKDGKALMAVKAQNGLFPLTADSLRDSAALASAPKIVDISDLVSAPAVTGATDAQVANL
ncbi:hypothetical protein H4S02_006518 [Coemansia sp. RSA 2611]|nr:hypothetical protein H4S02_006518 [Coemansia sp. RSA 2611]